MNEVTLSELKKEETNRATCLKHRIQYVSHDGLTAERNRIQTVMNKKKK